MKLDNTSFVDQMSSRLKTYPQCYGAAALFYVGHALDHHANLRGLRLECPAIGKEFTDNIAFGRDPEGFLFYSDITDFDTANPTVHYHTFYNNESPRAVRVDFHSLKADNTENKNPFCSFLTRATEGLSNDYVTNPDTNDGAGVWQDVFVASTYGKVRKETGSDEVTIMMEPIGKEIVFDTSGHSTLKPINTMGTFTYVNAGVIKAGQTRIDFNPDRVVLWDNSQASKVVGYFIPVTPMASLGDSVWNQPNATIKDIPVGPAPK